MRRKRLLILITEYYYFESHKQDLTVAAAEEGYDVFVAARRGTSAVPANAPFMFVDLAWKRSPSLFGSLVRFFPELLRVRRVIEDIKPDVLHNIALKPTIMGALVAASRDMSVIHSINGLGFVFYARSVFARCVQMFCGWVLRLSARRNKAQVVLQNRDDAAYVRDRLGLPATHIQLIRGSGIDLERFKMLPEPENTPVRFLVIGRLLFMKGVDVAVAAHQILRTRGVMSEIAFAGGRDDGNPSSIPEATISAWAKLPGVLFLGHVANIEPIIANAHVVLQPAVAGEGLPRSLLEAAACGRALIATDVSGNREIVDSDTGLLVPPSNPLALADAMMRMAEDSALRARLAQAARSKAEREFSAALIHQQHRQLYGTIQESESGA